jgi:hypothetical protein
MVYEEEYLISKTALSESYSTDVKTKGRINNELGRAKEKNGPELFQRVGLPFHGKDRENSQKTSEDMGNAGEMRMRTLRITEQKHYRLS